MLTEARRLYGLGLAVIWLKGKSKIPLKAGWTKGDREAWDILNDSFKYGINMGVRLGRASKLSDGFYLGAIDCDVKSEDPKDLKELETKLRGLLKNTGPVVASGRGNGSRHIYVKSAEPLRPRRYAQSTKKVRVLIPSVKPSKAEKLTLSREDLEDGIRLRAAWEISIMGEGQQCVLPPSIHPDTENPYEWAYPLEKVDTIPLFIDEGATAAGVVASGVVEDFKVEAVDLKASALDAATVALIVDGEGCEDRSAALFGVVIRMLKASFSDNQILTVLTEKDYYLGAAPYEHAQTSSRKRAAEWVRKYTLEKAKRETLAEYQFADTVKLSDPLNPEAAAKQREEIVRGASDWTELIQRFNDDRPRPSYHNAYLVINNAGGAGVLKKNLFSGDVVYGKRPPWNKSRAGTLLGNDDISNIVHWLSQEWRLEIPEAKIFHAITQIATENGFHPVREYINALEWDGTPRLDNWLKTYLGAEGPDVYVQAIARKTLCAMVARVFCPGIKFDHVLILEGYQGIGKSSAIEILSAPWFTDAEIDIENKDAPIVMRGYWVVELGELSAMRKHEVEHIKSFVTRKVDRFRPPYGRVAEDFPRQNIFIGSTNSDYYLKDETGNRRFWPVKVNRCDFKKLTKDKDQLIAEARFAWELGEPLYLENNAEKLAAIEAQNERVLDDAWVDKLRDFFNQKKVNFPADKFTTNDLFSDFGPMAAAQPTVGHQMRIAAALRVLGFEQDRKQTGGSRKRVWVRICPT